MPAASRDWTEGVPDLSAEGYLPSLSGATGWLNSAPLTTEELRGKVVVANFWTYTCVNWIRTLPYVRAWASKYRDRGLVVLGIHTPEFPFENEPDNVRRAAAEMRVDYPIAMDNDYALWNGFGNHYWPATFIADTEGRIRHHQFGEGGYDECERVIQTLLRDSGATDIGAELVSPDVEGLEVGADWQSVGSPETYLGYDQARGFALQGGAAFGESRTYVQPSSLDLNTWALSGQWTIGEQAIVLDRADGRIAFRFRARDVNLVMTPGPSNPEVRFRVLIDGQPPGSAHGLDTDELGDGILAEPRLHQLVRQPGPAGERIFEITFLDPGAEAFVFTFG
jgi:thiol-disulfide isomerase/thioredoxin